MTLARAIGLMGAVLSLPAGLIAQDVISAKAGLIDYSEGKVFLNDKPLVLKLTKFQEVKENERLRTGEGRAEVLLTPGVFLRLGEDSSIEMLSSGLDDVRLRLLSGAAVIEADELEKENAVTVLIGEAKVQLLRNGLYRLDVFEQDAPRLRVFAGEALVTGPAGEFRIKQRKEIELAGDFVAKKFDPEDTDPLDRWSRRRANYLAMANVSASRMAYRQGASYSRSSWIWNPYYGMYTFLPYRSIAWSPYGFGFYSPRAVYYVYNPPRSGGGGGDFSMPRPVYNSSYGYNTIGSTSAGTSSVAAGSVGASPSAGGAASSGGAGGGATVSRGGDTGGGGARR